MKKVLTLLLALLMCLTLVGCDKKEEQKQEEKASLTFEISTLFIVPDLESTKNVQDVMNEYLASLGKNYEVKLKVTSIGDYLTTVPMELAGGGDDCPDIVQVFNLAADVENGYYVNLDPYLEKELKPTKELIGNVIGSGKVNGSFYMIPRFFGTVLDWKWVYNKEYAEGAGIDASTVKDMTTLEAACAQMKAKYPNDFFIVYTDQFPNIFRLEDHTSLVGTYGATVGSSKEIVNYYATDAYKKAIYKAYDFRQKGYADPEGSNNTASHDTVVMSGSSKGVIMGHSAEASSIADMFTNTNTYGATFGASTIAIDDLATDTLGVGISYTCKHPEAAADFINLLYTDEFVWDTLIYGKEGQDWAWNSDKTMFTYPEGKDFNSIPYNLQYSCGMIGNGFYTRAFEGATDSGSDPEYGKKLMDMAWCPPLYGFIPNVANVANEVAAVQNVVEQYNDSLIFGDVNPDEKYPEFLSALQAAGIDKIIAEFNSQAASY